AGGGSGRWTVAAGAGVIVCGRRVAHWGARRDGLAGPFRSGPPAEVDGERGHSPRDRPGPVCQPLAAPTVLGHGAALVRDQGPSRRGARPPNGVRGRRAAEPLRMDRPGGVERRAGGGGTTAAAVPAPCRPGGFV